MNRYRLGLAVIGGGIVLLAIWAWVCTESSIRSADSGLYASIHGGCAVHDCARDFACQAVDDFCEERRKDECTEEHRLEDHSDSILNLGCVAPVVVNSCTQFDWKDGLGKLELCYMYKPCGWNLIHDECRGEGAWIPVWVQGCRST